MSAARRPASARTAPSAPARVDLPAVFAALPGLTVVFDVDEPRFTILAASDSMLATIAWARDELVGLALADGFPDPGPLLSREQGMDSLRESLVAALRTGAPQRMSRQRHDVRRRDGGWETRWWDAINTPVRDADGVVRWLLHQAEDATARVQREREASQQLAQIEAIYRDAPVGLAVLDRDLRYVHVNDRLADMNGIPAAAHLGRTVREVLPHLGGEIEAIARRVLDTGEPVRDLAISGETAAQPGAVRNWVEQWYPLRDESGEIVGINIVVDEVTEQRRAEAALRAGEERLRRMVNVEGVGVLIFDEAGTLVDANDTFLEMTGYRREAIDARALNWRAMTPPEYVAESEAQMERLARTGRMGPYEKEYILADGSRSWMLFAGAAMGDGTAVEYCIDVSDRKRAENALRAGEARQAFLLRLSDALRPVTDPLEAQSLAARMTLRQLGLDRCYYGEIDGSLLTIHYDSARADLPPVFGSYSLVEMPFLTNLLRGGRTLVLPDIEAPGAADEEARVLCRAASVAAHVSTPLIKEGRLVGVFVIAQSVPRAWTTDEIRLAHEIAERTWAAVARARAEARLHESQRRLDDALATARMAYWDWDPLTDRTVGSASIAEVFGLLPGAHIESREDGMRLVHPDDYTRHRVRALDAAARGDGWHAEFRIVRPRDGEVAWLEERATMTRDPVTGVAHMTGLVWDITDRRRAAAAAERDRLAQDRDTLRRQLAAAEEEERRRLARELHDQLGQHLTAFSLGLAEARRLLAVGESAESRLAQLEELARLMTRDARYLALELRPPELDDMGLESALVTYVDQWRKRYGVEADLDVGGTTGSQLPADVATAIYRIAQEALTNVAKHARAQHVTVQLDASATEARLLVEDDGAGFDVEAASARARAQHRLGLASMRERAMLVAGTLEVESTPGTGTAIYVRVPLERAGELEGEASDGSA